MFNVYIFLNKNGKIIFQSDFSEYKMASYSMAYIIKKVSKILAIMMYH